MGRNHGFHGWARMDLNLDLDLDPDRKINDLEKELDGDSEILSYRDAEREELTTEDSESTEGEAPKGAN